MRRESVERGSVREEDEDSLRRLLQWEMRHGA
jgi:hypothetical protein